jgi:hypothetical protein
MNIDFTNDIKKLKEKDVLHKPFPVADGGYALFAKSEDGNFVKMIFSNQDHIKQYLNNAGYDWGNEGKDEFRNFDCLNRLLTVMPELSDVETVAADPQWEISEKAVDLPENSSKRSMEDMPDAVELREVDHPIGYDDRTHASEEKDYSELWQKVNATKKLMGQKKFAMGDMVENINPDCKHFKSEGEIVGCRSIKSTRINRADDKPGEKEDELGFVFAYQTTNAGKNWDEGDTLEKTPDQLEKIKGFNPRLSM